MEFTWIVALVSAIGGAAAAIIGAAFKRNQNKKDQYEHEEKLIKLSQDLANSNKILNDFSSMSRDFDYIRDGMTQLHKEIKDVKAEVVKVKKNCASTDALLLRREIYNIYWSYENEKTIPEREFETALNLYTVYHSLGCNGTAEHYIEEIKQWKRI